MIGSKGKVHGFTEYNYSKTIVEDFPAIIKVCEQLIPILEKKKHYTAVLNMLEAIKDSKMMMTMQYKSYLEIYNKKGLRDENEE